MGLNLEPVKVDIEIETPSLERGAFYKVCFITENDEAPRTLEISTLSELLANGYTREDLAYNFCVGVFAQQGIESIFIRAKRSYESYEDAFSADSNDGYYYLVIESKDSQIVSDFNDFVVSSDDYKLQFYSSNEEPVEGRKLVHYFFDRGSDKNDFYLNKVMGDPDYLENVETPPVVVPPDDDREGLVFTVQDINIGQDAFTVWSSANAPLGNFQWSLENLDTGTVVASSDGTLSEGFLVENSELSLNVTIPVDEKATRYEFKSEGRWIGLDCIPKIESLSEGANVLSIQPKYKVVVEQYAKNFSSHTFYLNDADLIVPDTLPSHITDCDEMFLGCQFFNQDISSWDVSAVENMDSMFMGCKSFNQDLSQWCVSLISELPDSFSSGSALTRGNLPVWGTCPRGEASNLRMFTVDPFDESYSVATRLSQRVGEEPKLTAIQLQQQRLAYPEGAWIGLCGNVFPSRVNWLHKNLIKSDIRKINSKPKLPELSSTTMLVIKKRATVGSGLTTQGIVIHEQVSLDWIKWALGRKVWKTLYSNERINATTEGLELIANDVKEVLNLALEEEMLSEYQITEVLLDRYTNNLSLKFSCRLMETILFVDISGSLYY